MAKRADFKLTKTWGIHPKGKVFPNMDRARARSLQDVHKVGKIIEPKQDKADPQAKGRSVK